VVIKVDRHAEAVVVDAGRSDTGPQTRAARFASAATNVTAASAHSTPAASSRTATFVVADCDERPSVTRFVDVELASR